MVDGSISYQTDAYVNGEWTAAASGARFDVTNHATGEVIASVSDLRQLDVEGAIAAATLAFPAWSKQLAPERANALKRWFALILEHEERLAQIMTAEQGKPLAEARGEIRYAASFVEWFSEEARRVYGDIIPAHPTATRLLTLKQAVGVVAAITPWNFPAAMITRKVGAALAAGCTVLVKPSELTPLTALALADLAQKAGIPAGVFNVVTTSDPEQFSVPVMSSNDVRKISFTGSTAVGKMLLRRAADSVKRVSLELGGNAPFIVFDDANVEAAVEGAIAYKYRNGGQTCVCSNRIYVQEGIMPQFSALFAKRVSQLQVGPGTSPTCDIGPLINQKAVDKVQRLIQNATEGVAKVLLGWKLSPLGGTFFAPTILVGGRDSMDISKEEIFGPVSVLYSFTSEEEVIKRANDTAFGLAAYFYTQDLARSWRVSEQLEYGIVGINTGLISTAVGPFGGMKESGLGREGSRYGVDEYLETKFVCVGGI